MIDKENEFIEKAAKRIIELDIDIVAIFLLQTFKPLVFIGGELANFFLAPYLPLLDDNGYDFINVFQKRENIEKLIKKIEEASISHNNEIKDSKTGLKLKEKLLLIKKKVLNQ